MISFPVWRNEDLTFSGDVLRYYITFNGETVYNGRAYRRPGATDTKIFVDRIIGDYLENEIDIEAVGVTQQEDAYGVFDVWSQDGTHLAQYGVLFNFADEWSGETMVLAEPVNGHLDPRMNMYWSKYNTGQTTEVVVTEDIYYFEVASAVTVAWNAGEAVVPVNTNYPYGEIQAVCPAGVVETGYGAFYAFDVPINENPYAPADYTIEWYRKGVHLGTTVITVEAQEFYFYCDSTAEAGMDGDEVTIGIRTNYLPADIRVVLPDGWTLVSLSNRECVIQTTAGSLGNYNVYFYDTDDNLLGTTIVTVNEGYFTCPATFRIGNEGGQFTIPISTNISLARLSATVPSGLTFVSMSRTAVVLTAEPSSVRTEQSFDVKFYRDGSTLVGTTVVLQDCMDWFEVPPEVGVPYVGGDVAIRVDTNYDLTTISVVTQTGAVLVEKGRNYVLINVPANNGTVDVPYTVQFYRNGELIGTTNVVVGVLMADKYLTIEAISGGTVEFHPETVNKAYRYANVTFDYRKNGGQWTSANVTFYRDTYPTVVTIAEVSAGDRVEFRANDIANQTAITGIPFMSIVTTAEAKVYGNIMSMFYGDDFEDKTALPRNSYDYQRFKWFAGYLSNLTTDVGTKLVDAKSLYFPVQTVPKNVFWSMFEGCKMLVTPPMLQTRTFTDAGSSDFYGFSRMFLDCESLQNVAITPSSGMTYSECACLDMYRECTSLTYVHHIPGGVMGEESCRAMFYGCSALEKVAVFPDTNTAPRCYAELFYNCYKLHSVPQTLPATALTEACYYFMFFECRSLETPPALPATTLATQCYYEMFAGSGIRTAPTLSAQVMQTSCYSGMFVGCFNLTVPPVLPAMTLANACYQQMFLGSAILTAPALPATSLADDCYRDMFHYCKFTTAPALPATTLSKRCYYTMFSECENLVNGPNLNAPTLVSECYQAMFEYCSKLKYVKCLATNPSTSYNSGWMRSVPSGGTFVKKAGVSWSSGSNGIPYGWTVQEE